MPAFGENYVEHFAQDYAGALELAKTNATFATHDSDILQYFALDVYAYDIAVPGVGCPGTVTQAAVSMEATPTSTMEVTSTSAMEAVPTSTMEATPMSAMTETATPATADAASAVADVPAVSSAVLLQNPGLI